MAGFRFITKAYRVASFLLMVLPTIGVSYFAWDWAREVSVRQVEREQREAASALLDVVRARYDTIQNFLVQREQFLRKNQAALVDTLYRTARELELETARKNLSFNRGQEVFLNVIMDVSQRHSYLISIFNTKGEIVYCPMLPKGFDLSENQWVQAMLGTDSGEVQYSWRYPGEAETMDRILTHRLVEGWGWIIVVESIKEDPLSVQFADQQYRGLRDYIAGYHAPAGGIAMILSLENNEIVAHPEIRGGALDTLAGASKLISTRKGVVRYKDDYGFKRKAWVEYFSPLQWLIVVTAREDQISVDADGIVKKFVGVAVGLTIVILFLFYRLQRVMVFDVMTRRRSSDIDIE
ncbi:MAG: cache domain-containing protein [bacterium]